MKRAAIFALCWLMPACCLAQRKLTITGVVEASESLDAARVYLAGEEGEPLRGQTYQNLDDSGDFTLSLIEPIPQSVRVFVQVAGQQRACVTSLGTGADYGLRIALHPSHTPAGKAQSLEAVRCTLGSAVVYGDHATWSMRQYGVVFAQGEFRVENETVGRPLVRQISDFKNLDPRQIIIADMGQASDGFQQPVSWGWGSAPAYRPQNGSIMPVRDLSPARLVEKSKSEEAEDASKEAAEKPRSAKGTAEDPRR